MKPFLVILSLSFLSLASAQAAVTSCEPLTITDVNSPLCGAAEVRAAQAAMKAGLQADIASLRAFGDDCKVESTQAIRLNVNAGNHGKDIQVLILTKATCTSKYFVSRPLEQFPILVKFWSNHEETNFANFEVTKLYEQF